MSVAETEGITIEACMKNLPYQPRKDDQYLFPYQVTIRNESETAARLLTRRWIIQDALNYVEERLGEGVVGKCPHLEPGDVFSYLSFCPLKTRWGVMRGVYGMIRPDGQYFEAKIAPFPLMIASLLN